MNKLRILSLIFILVELASFISSPCIASPTQIPKAHLEYVELYGYTAAASIYEDNVEYIRYGEKLAVYVEIHVEKNSPVPLENPYVFITITKPNGEQITLKKLIKDKINPKEIKGYSFLLDYVADQVGTWKLKVELGIYINNEWYKLDEKEGTSIVRFVPKAEVIVMDIGKNWVVEYGQKITFKVKVCVKKDSPLPLDGFFMILGAYAPDKREYKIKQITINDKINQGECKEYTFVLGQAGQIGTWKFDVWLYTKGGEYMLDIKKGTFKVKGGTPAPLVAEIEVLDMVGYATTASMICAGIALILSRVVR